VHVHDEIRVTIAVCHRVWGDACGDATQAADEDLAMRRRQPAGTFQHGVEHPDLPRGKIVRLPIIARAGQLFPFSAPKRPLDFIGCFQLG
jgi:hypothetical protein